MSLKHCNFYPSDCPVLHSSFIEWPNSDDKIYTQQVALSTSRANAILENADHSLMSAIQAAQRSYVISDPTMPDNPIIFASKGFLDLSGYTLENTLGRNCRFLQGYFSSIMSPVFYEFIL